MTVAPNKSESKKKRPFWRRQSRGHTVDTYEVGHIRTEDAVFVEDNGVVVGDIFAPKVVIRGVVYGTVVALELVMEPGGELWGDAYTVKAQIKADSKIRGWLNTIDSETYDAYFMRKQTTLIRPDETANGHLPDVLHTAVADLSAAMPTGRANILEQLREEAGAAISARMELERAFNTRVSELSGANISEAERLRERISIINTEHIAMQQRLAESNKTLQQQQLTLKDRQDALKKAREDLQSITKENTQFKETDYQQARQIERLELDIEQVKGDLKEVTGRAEQAESRNASLETTLQSSLQRTAEQEDALLRWQELAELNEERAKKAEEDVESAAFDAREYNQTLDVIKGQRDQIEKEWEAAYQEVQELRAQLQKQSGTPIADPKLADRVKQLESRLENKNGELQITRQTMVETTAAYTQIKHRIGGLEKELLAAKPQAEKASQLETELAELQATYKKLQEEFESIRDQTEEKSAIIESQQTAVGRIAELETLTYRLEQSEQQGLNELMELQEKHDNTLVELEKLRESHHEKEQELSLMKGQLAETRVIMQELEDLRQTLRFSERRINDAEDDIEVYQRQIQSQGSRLAEIQSDLIEKEIQVQQMIEKSKEQASEIKKIKQLAIKRIQRLEQKVTAKQKQVNDLVKVIERRQQ